MEKLIIYAILLATHLAAYYKIFEKAGRKGWEALVPGYNVIVLLKLLKRPWYWALVLIFPGTNVLMLMILNYQASRAMSKFGLSSALAAIFVPMVYMPYLAFKDADAKWIGPEDTKNKKRSFVAEWGDAIVFAVIAASIIRGYFIEAFTIPTSSMEKSLLIGDFLFVSKISYGAKVPQTPLSFPFAHNIMPLASRTPSYLEWMKLPYYRLPGLGSVERNDVVVFNYPEGDTVLLDAPQQSYYNIVNDQARSLRNSDNAKKKKPWSAYRKEARRLILRQFDYTVRPVDKRDNYIKRCVAIPGDELEVRDGVVIVNGETENLPELHQFEYQLTTSTRLAPSMLKSKYDVNLQDMDPSRTGGAGVTQTSAIIPLTDAALADLKKNPVVTDAQVLMNEPGTFATKIRTFPNTPKNQWSRDFFGPLQIPAKGTTVELTMENLPLYKRIIRVYEGNELQIANGKIYINGEETTTYTFAFDYFFMMGDNRHNSLDSRFWGFVPEDHIVGKAQFVWFSYDSERDLTDGKIRFDRFFSGID